MLSANLPENPELRACPGMSPTESAREMTLDEGSPAITILPDLNDLLQCGPLQGKRK